MADSLVEYVIVLIIVTYRYYALGDIRAISRSVLGLGGIEERVV
jgi:hypothetical protein